MNEDYKVKISAALSEMESRHDCWILFAVESGSRAWGFASPDSDYDIRGVFIRPLDWYLQLKSNDSDTIVEELSGDIDVSLWDLRKALSQMSKSNASFLEWLGSPIVYRDDGLLGILNELKSECVNPKHIAYHYASMFRKAIEARNCDGTISIKKLCYSLRAAICLRYVMDVGEMPPTVFSDVIESVKISERERAAIREVLSQKERAKESDVVMPDHRLVDLLMDRYDAISNHVWRKQGITRDAYAKLEDLFRGYVKNEQAV